MLNILRKKILIIGDCILDSYIDLDFKCYKEGLPVYSIKNVNNTLGGAGNVLNQLLGADQEVIFITKLGKDIAAENILKILEDRKIRRENILIYSSEDINTTVKRYYNIGFRTEINDERCDKGFEHFFQEIVNSLDLSGLDAVIFSDYCKGVFDLEPYILRSFIKKINSFKIPIFVDSKRTDLSIFNECTYIKTNSEEFCNQAHILISDLNEDVVKSMSAVHNIPNWIVTTSETGLIAVIKDEIYRIPSFANGVKSAVGAGDSFLSYFTISVISKLNIDSVLRIASIAAAIQVENTETYLVTLDEVERRYGVLEKKTESIKK